MSEFLRRPNLPPGLPGPTTPAIAANSGTVAAPSDADWSAAGRLLDFRRGGSPRRRRRSVLPSLLKPLTVALLVVALPLGLVTWVLTTGRFELRDVLVDGASPRIPLMGVRRDLAPFFGDNLVLLSLPAVEETLRRDPWIDTVEVSKELPDRLRVAVTERRPVALLMRGNRLVFADSGGRAIAPVGSPEEQEAARRLKLVVVTFPPASHSARMPADAVAGALEVAGELGRVEPDWAASLSQIEVLGEEDYRLHSGALRFPLLVTRGQVGEKLRRLETLMPELDRRYPVIQAIDLRFSHRIVVQPGIANPPARGAGA
jgi:cell division protein FtsQ